MPCSLLKNAITILEGRRDYVSAVREDVAIGLASGAALAGSKAAVWMQNSGLGVSVNALASLNLLYEIPVLLVVSWRGCGPDAPEHALSGAITRDLLQLLGIPHLVLEAGRIEEQVLEADGELERTRRPVAIVVKKGVL